MMATEDELRERVAQAIREKGNRFTLSRADAALAALRPGDRLPGGLIVAREEPTLKDWRAFIEAVNFPVLWDTAEELAGLIERLHDGYKAMLAAQEGDG